VFHLVSVLRSSFLLFAFIVRIYAYWSRGSYGIFHLFGIVFQVSRSLEEPKEKSSEVNYLFALFSLKFCDFDRENLLKSDVPNLLKSDVPNLLNDIFEMSS
jgi:hypothetical protein